MYEVPEVFCTTQRKARKKHRCCECGRLIDVSEKYQYSSGIWDHQPASYRQCLNCHEIMVAAASVSRAGEGPTFCGLRDWFIEFKYAGFDGKQWLDEMSEHIGADPEKLNLLLRI